MFQSIRERLVILLLAVLPFHALLVTSGTKLILGPGHAPIAALAAWKEGLLAVILLIATIEFLRKSSFKLDVIDWLIVSLLAIALSLPKTNFLFGFKYDFVPLIVFMILRRVTWSPAFWALAERALLWIGVAVAAYGIITFFLPLRFFSALGYSESYSLYVPDGPLAAFQKISGTSIRRIQSAFSGPNQFGIWLLIPISVYLTKLTRMSEPFGLFQSRKSKIKNPATSSGESEKRKSDRSFGIGHLSLVIFLGLALLLTFSRSAWIGAFVIGCASAWRMASKKFFAYGVGSFLIFAIGMSLLFPSVFIRRMSLIGHVARPLQAVRMIVEHPMGLGLGSAGPAANHTRDPCVFLEPGSDFSWARENSGLCIFVGDEQVQPADRRCDCPFLPENWYLQIGVELGILGMVLYVGLIWMMIWRLAVANIKWKVKNKSSILNSQFSMFLAFFAVSIAAFFLHAWEDSAVAYTAWILSAAALSRQNLIQDRRN